jgi:hypothetical protein
LASVDGMRGICRKTTQAQQNLVLEFAPIAIFEEKLSREVLLAVRRPLFPPADQARGNVLKIREDSWINKDIPGKGPFRALFADHTECSRKDTSYKKEVVF